MESATASSMEIQRVDPLAHADALKALFASHERAEFAGYFDRAYPDAVREGGCSWIGIDAQDGDTGGGGGSIVMHVARFPQRFRVGDRMATGGLLVNLLSARSQRSFFPALSLVRRVVADSRADGNIDFLYGDPNDQARSLLRLAGFAPVGELERFVLPLRDPRWYADAAVRAYHMAIGARGRTQGVAVTRHGAAEFDCSSLEVPGSIGERIRPCRPASLYRRRLADYPSAADEWIVVQSGNARVAAAVRALGNGSVLLCALERPGGTPLTAIVPALARELRRAGHHQLWLWTMAQTRFAGELRSAGFVPRHERLPVLGIGLTALGTQVLAASATWETTHLDFDR